MTATAIAIRRIRPLAALLGAVAAAVLLAGCGESSLDGSRITVPGTLPERLVDAWSTSFERSSGAIVTATRPAGHQEPGTRHMPLVLMPLAIAYRIVNYDRSVVPSGLRLDSSTMAVIFRGRIENWVNSRILALNGHLRLPDHLITVCHRSDPARETLALSTFLSLRSEWWREGIGSGRRVRWQVLGGFRVPMVAVKGQEGMVRCLKERHGSIGYMDAAEATRNHFTVALVRNHSRHLVGPTAAAAMTAARNVEVQEDMSIPVLNAPGDDAYAITDAGYASIPPDLCRAGMELRRAEAAKAWLAWTLGDEGQAVARRTGHVPLPDYLRARGRAALAHLACDGKPIG